jgi:hypothetical protein
MTQLMGYLLENCCEGDANKSCPPMKSLKSKC